MSEIAKCLPTPPTDDDGFVDSVYDPKGNMEDFNRRVRSNEENRNFVPLECNFRRIPRAKGTPYTGQAPTKPRSKYSSKRIASFDG